MNDPLPISPELQYVALLFLIFIVPRVLQRYRIPTAITSLALGALAGLGLGLFQGDHTIELLSTLGIVSLFLFAGLEVNLGELRRELPVLSQHIAVQVLALVAVAFGARSIFGLEYRPATLVALALLTPSTGFILDSLHTLGVTDRERFWIKSKAIATELVALMVLFVTLQSSSFAELGFSVVVLAAMIAALPYVFRVFAKVVVPYAPKSEFAFLLMIAILCAYATRRLGVYYLVGAFAVGLTAQRFRQSLPAITSEQMIHAIEMFASFFVPFYFFGAGLHLRRDDFEWKALGLGLLLLLTMVAFRVALTALHRRLALREPMRTGVRIGVSMLPTLVFTLVIAGILRERFDLSPTLFGALIVYTLTNTLVPSFALRLPPNAFDSIEAPELALAGDPADPRTEGGVNSRQHGG